MKNERRSKYKSISKEDNRFSDSEIANELKN
jgi:hypothetical protein